MSSSMGSHSFYRTSATNAVLQRAMFLRSMLLGAVVAALVPASASAATVDALKRCYVVAQEKQRESISITGRGFTQRSIVDVFVDDIVQISPPPQALYDGTVVGTIPAPFVDAGERAFTLRLAEQNNPANVASWTSKVTRFSVEQIPKAAKTDKRVRFRG